MERSLEHFSRKELAHIARAAKRNVNSEAVLILTAGFALIMVCMFLLGKFTFLPIAAFLGTGPTVVWVVGSVLLSVIWCLGHVTVTRPKVARARALEAQHHKERFESRQQALDAKRATLEDGKNTA